MRLQNGPSTDLLHQGCGPAEIFSEASRFITEGCSVLDLGCGLGLLTDHLPSGRISYQGIDSCSESIFRCRSRYGTRSDFRFDIGDIMTLDFGPPAYEAVALLNVLHLPGLDPATLLRKSYRALKPGGRLIVSGPTKADLQYSTAPLQGHPEGQRGYYCSAEGMEALAKLVGFPHTVMARPDFRNGEAYLVVVQK